MDASVETREQGLGVLGWCAVLGGIAAWMAHLVTLAALADLTCRHHDVVWVMHGLTAGLGAAAVWAAAGCWRLGQRPGTGPRTQWLGRFGLLVAVINVVLIVWEGMYVPFLRTCA